MGLAEASKNLGLRVVLFPSPFQGHINPMFHLANLLHRRGFSITILHARFNSLDPHNHPQFQFVPIHDGVSDEPVSFDNVMGIINVLNANTTSSSFRDQMAMLLQRSKEPIAGVIVDSLLCSVQAVARQLGVPTLVLRASSAATFRSFMSMPLLFEKGYLPIQDSKLDVQVHELPPLRVRDLPFLWGDLYEFSARICEEIRASNGIIFNTLDVIEGDELESIRHELPVPVFAVGPLHKRAPGSSSSLLAQDPSCMVWLDEQAPSSVLYVSFGSISSMSEAELAEAAWGLANSHQPFLWVIRPGSTGGGSDQASLPPGFVEETQNRSKIVRWAPQQEVLAHQAVGGFWTHNGWNSTLEGLCDGVPMLCQPWFGDQPLNARYVTHVWRAGILLDDGLERVGIERAITALMSGRKAAEIRERAAMLKEDVAHRVKAGGSSHRNSDGLVDLLLSFNSHGQNVM